MEFEDHVQQDLLISAIIEKFRGLLEEKFEHLRTEHQIRLGGDTKVVLMTEDGSRSFPIQGLFKSMQRLAEFVQKMIKEKNFNPADCEIVDMMVDGTIVDVNDEEVNPAKAFFKRLDPQEVR